MAGMSTKLGAWLRSERLARGWDVPEMARRLSRAARDIGIAVAAGSAMHRNVYRWEAGHTGVSERYELLYCRALDIPRNQFGPPRRRRVNGEVQGDQSLSELAAGSQEFGEWAAASPVADATIELYAAQAARLARGFEHAAPAPLLADARKLRDQVTARLRRHLHLGQARDLYLIAAQICGCMAWMTGDLGDYPAAETHAWAAWVCADQAGHDSARAWVRVTQSKLAYWSGHYRDSAQLAQDGLTYKTSDSGRVFLELFLARARARAGDRGQAAQALRRAATQRERVCGPDLLGGIWGLTPARYHGLVAGARLLLDDPQDALDEAAQAVVLSQAPPQAGQHLFAEMLFRTDLAVAHLRRTDLDGAVNTLAPVLALDAGMRTEPVVQQLGHLQQQLTQRAFSGSPLAKDLHSQIGAYAAAADFAVRSPGQLQPAP